MWVELYIPLVIGSTKWIKVVAPQRIVNFLYNIIYISGSMCHHFHTSGIHLSFPTTISVYVWFCERNAVSFFFSFFGVRGGHTINHANDLKPNCNPDTQRDGNNHLKNTMDSKCDQGKTCNKMIHFKDVRNVNFILQTSIRSYISKGVLMDESQGFNFSSIILRSSKRTWIL